jgi:hypothetical protein
MTDLLQLPAIFYKKRYLFTNISLIPAYINFIRPGYAMFISYLSKINIQPETVRYYPYEASSKWRVASGVSGSITILTCKLSNYPIINN